MRRTRARASAVSAAAAAAPPTAASLADHSMTLTVNIALQPHITRAVAAAIKESSKQAAQPQPQPQPQTSDPAPAVPAVSALPVTVTAATADSHADANMNAPEPEPALHAVAPLASPPAAAFAATPSASISPTLDSSSSKASSASIDDRMMDEPANAEAKEGDKQEQEQSIQVEAAAPSSSAPAAAAAAASAAPTWPALLPAPVSSVRSSLRTRPPQRKSYADLNSSDDDAALRSAVIACEVQVEPASSRPRTRSSSAGSSSNKKAGAIKASKRVVPAVSLPVARLDEAPAPLVQPEERKRKKAKHDQPAQPQPPADAPSVISVASAAASAVLEPAPLIRQSERHKQKQMEAFIAAAATAAAAAAAAPSLSSSSSQSSAAAASAGASVAPKRSKPKPISPFASAASSAAAAPSSAELKPKSKSTKANATKQAEPAAAAADLPVKAAPQAATKHRWTCQRCKKANLPNPKVDANLSACPRCGEPQSEETRNRSAASFAAAARRAQRRELASAAAGSASIAPMPVAGKFAFNLSPGPAPAAAAAAAPSQLPSWLTSVIQIPTGWQLLETDVCIIGGGAAGLQCAEHLSRCAKSRVAASGVAAEPLSDEPSSAAAAASSGSSAATASAAAPAARPPLDILILEGRNRLGGRIDTATWRTHGREIAVERGAAFVHGFHHGNLAAETAVRYNIARRLKNDNNDAWFNSGERFPGWLVQILREMIEKINARMMKQAQQVAQTMTERTDKERQVRRREGEVEAAAADVPVAASAAAAAVPVVGLLPANAVRQAKLHASVSRPPSNRQELQVVAAPRSSKAVVDLTLESSSESESSESSDSGSDSDDSSSSEDDSENNRGGRASIEPFPIVPDVPLAASLPIADEPAAMELSTPPPSAVASVVSGSAAAPYSSAASDESASAASMQSEELHSPMPANLLLSAPVTRKRRRISDSSASSLRSKQTSDDAANKVAIEALQKEDAAAASAASRRITRGFHRPQPTPSLAPITKKQPMAYGNFARTLHRLMEAPPIRAGAGSMITAYVPELDCSVQQLFDDALASLMQEPDIAASLTPHLRSVLFHIQCIIAGYICPLSQLSAFDMANGSANGGGDRSLLDGYVQVLHALLARLHRRSKRGQCKFRILKEHTVNCIEQMKPKSQAVTRQPFDEAASSSSTAAAASSVSESPAYALVSCPNQRTIVAARFVVVTASIGILQSSIKFESQLAQRHLHLLQPEARRRREMKQPPKPHTQTHVVRAASAELAASAAASAASDEKKSEWNGSAAAASATVASASSAAVAPCPAFPPLFPFVPPPDIPGPHVYQLEAGILFEPQLSPLVREAIETRGMGLENKIMLQFPEGSRFWPKHHMLHAANYPMYRFYNLDGIRDESCDILVAHLPPPYAQELEHLPLEEVQRRVMIVLHDMFSTSRNGGPTRTPQYSESSQPFVDSYSGDEIASEFELSESSGDEEEQKQRRAARQLKIAATRADKTRRFADPSLQTARSRDRTAAFRADSAWKTRPVVLPLRIEITKWGQDPFAQGAYSCIPVGCNLKMVHRLQKPEPEESLSERAGVLYFAGEATDIQDNQQVHGAMKSGVRAATQIWKRIEQQ